MPYEEPPRSQGALFSGVGFCTPRVLPSEADLRRAADVLNAVLVLAPNSSVTSWDRLAELAYLLSGD